MSHIRKFIFQFMISLIIRNMYILHDFICVYTILWKSMILLYKVDSYVCTNHTSGTCSCSYSMRKKNQSCITVNGVKISEQYESERKKGTLLYARVKNIAEK